MLIINIFKKTGYWDIDSKNGLTQKMTKAPATPTCQPVTSSQNLFKIF